VARIMDKIDGKISVHRIADEADVRNCSTILPWVITCFKHFMFLFRRLTLIVSADAFEFSFFTSKIV
jgi:hypothetical protein